VQTTLERAQCLRALARAFGSPGDLARLAADLDAWRRRAPAEIACALDRACAALAEAPATLAEEHDRLLGGRIGSVAAREGAWGDPRRITATELADVSGFLAAFRLETKGLPPDHLATQCELASVLALKEAYALAQGWDEQSAIAGHAYESLVADHLARWAVPFAARVRVEAEHGFYAAVSDALELYVRSEAERLGAEIADVPMEPADAAAASCGGCAAPCP
jgi:TorA maturation chaperone TorD